MTKSKSNPRLCYSIKEAAEMTSVSFVQVWRYVHDGTWPSVKLGGAKQSRVVIPAHFLHKLVNQGKPPVEEK